MHLYALYRLQDNDLGGCQGYFLFNKSLSCISNKNEVNDMHPVFVLCEKWAPFYPILDQSSMLPDHEFVAWSPYKAMCIIIELAQQLAML